jgi:1,4-alpha-glucan branching enzyme
MEFIMIKKQFVKSRNIIKVTFETEAAAEGVALVADFNRWQPVPFKKLKNGRWQLVQELEPGQSYQFRYLLEQNGSRDFINDDNADYTVPNDQGTENAVINA